VRFRAAGRAWRKQVKGRDAMTRDGRPVWKVKLHAIDDARETSEDIWVEVAGEQPVLPHDGEVQLDGLLFAPWVNRKGEIVRSFRALSIAPLDGARASPPDTRAPGWETAISRPG
jgi:hypothetical protein